MKVDTPFCRMPPKQWSYANFELQVVFQWESFRIHTNAFGQKANAVGAELVPDFMFWRSKKHKFGWYLEPNYEYKFGPAHEHSLGISGGLLIAIP